MRRRISNLLPTVLALLLVALPTPTKAEEGLQVTLLANYGFALAAGGQTVLIDAFVTEPYSIYGAVPQEQWTALLAGEPPFHSVPLALVSHRHGDHFQPTAAKEFLAAHPETLLVSSPEVIDLLEAELETDSPLRKRLQRVLPEPGVTESIEREGLRVDFLRLRHGGQRWANLHNLGHRIHIGGRTVLHLGDADAAEGNYIPYGLEGKNSDLALIPYWFFQSPRGLKTIDRFLKAKHQIPGHIPHASAKETHKNLQTQDSKLWIPTQSGESRTFRANL